MFPTGVGIWFAALFSLSSLAIRGSLLEAVIVITHIDYLIPAATPPLGVIPRAIMALLVAATGWYVGRNVGQRIADSEVEANRAVSSPIYGAPAYDAYGSHQDGGTRRPFQVNEEVGGYYPPEQAPWGHEGAGHYPPEQFPPEQYQSPEYPAGHYPQAMDQTEYHQPVQAQPVHPDYQAGYAPPLSARLSALSGNARGPAATGGLYPRLWRTGAG